MWILIRPPSKPPLAAHMCPQADSHTWTASIFTGIWVLSLSSVAHRDFLMLCTLIWKQMHCKYIVILEGSLCWVVNSWNQGVVLPTISQKFLPKEPLSTMQYNKPRIFCLLRILPRIWKSKCVETISQILWTKLILVYFIAEPFVENQLCLMKDSRSKGGTHWTKVMVPTESATQVGPVDPWAEDYFQCDKHSEENKTDSAIKHDYRMRMENIRDAGH